MFDSPLQSRSVSVRLIDVGGLAAPQITNVETAENLSTERKYSSSCKYFGAEAKDR